MDFCHLCLYVDNSQHHRLNLAVSAFTAAPLVCGNHCNWSDCSTCPVPVGLGQGHQLVLYHSGVDICVPCLCHRPIRLSYLRSGPLAHKTVIAQMREGMLVSDTRGRVVSINPAAKAMLGLPAKNALGQPISKLIPGYANLDVESRVFEDGKVEISLGTGLNTRDYILFPTTLKDWRGVIVGQIFLLQDVTEQKQVQAKIMDSQRALAVLQEREQLARELHDNLGQVFAFVNTQGQAVRQLLSRGEITTADEYIARLVDVAHEADVDIRESIQELQGNLTKQGLFSTLEQYLTKYERNFGIHTEFKKA